MGTQKNRRDEKVILSLHEKRGRTGVWEVTVSEERQVTKDHSRFPDSAMIEAKKAYRMLKFFKQLAKALIRLRIG